jgi:hypothetical protein
VENGVLGLLFLLCLPAMHAGICVKERSAVVHFVMPRFLLKQHLPNTSISSSLQCCYQVYNVQIIHPGVFCLVLGFLLWTTHESHAMVEKKDANESQNARPSISLKHLRNYLHLTAFSPKQHPPISSRPCQPSNQSRAPAGACLLSTNR